MDNINGFTPELIIVGLVINEPNIRTIVMNQRNIATGVAVDYGFTFGGGECYARWSIAPKQPYGSWQKVPFDHAMEELYLQCTNWDE